MIEIGYVIAMVLKSYKQNTQHNVQKETLEPINITALENYASRYKMAANDSCFKASAINDAKTAKQVAV